MLPANFNKMSDLAKRKWLNENSDSIKRDAFYTVPMSDQEREEKRIELEKLSIKLEAIESEYDEKKKSFRDEINDIRSSIKSVVNTLRNGYIGKQGDKFEFRDFETNRIHVYNQDGVEVEQRPMTAEERQSTIGTQTRTANNE